MVFKTMSTVILYNDDNNNERHDNERFECARENRLYFLMESIMPKMNRPCVEEQEWQERSGTESQITDLSCVNA